MPRADCTVRALVNTLGIEYAKAEAIAADGGRRKGCGIHSVFVIAAAKRAGYRFVKVRGRSRTLSRFLREHPSGTYYARKRGHAFAIKDGWVLHEKLPPRTIVCDAWKLETL